MPPLKDAMATMTRRYGSDSGDQPTEGTTEVSGLLQALSRAEGFEAEDTRNALLAHLREVEAALGALHADLAQDADHVEATAVEARMLPAGEVLRGLDRYEARLERTVQAARRELEAAVARRKIGEAVRGSGLWRTVGGR